MPHLYVVDKLMIWKRCILSVCITDGTKVAFGNRDNYIYVYNVTEDGRKFHKIGRCSVSA